MGDDDDEEAEDDDDDDVVAVIDRPFFKEGGDDNIGETVVEAKDDTDVNIFDLVLLLFNFSCGLWILLIGEYIDVSFPAIMHSMALFRSLAQFCKMISKMLSF